MGNKWEMKYPGYSSTQYSISGSVSSRGSACRFTTWSRKGVVGTLGTYPGRCLRITWEYAGPNSRHASSTENACRSPTLLTLSRETCSCKQLH